MTLVLLHDQYEGRGASSDLFRNLARVEGRTHRRPWLEKIIATEYE